MIVYVVYNRNIQYQISYPYPLPRPLPSPAPVPFCKQKDWLVYRLSLCMHFSRQIIIQPTGGSKVKPPIFSVWCADQCCREIYIYIEWVLLVWQSPNHKEPINARTHTHTLPINARIVARRRTIPSGRCDACTGYRWLIWCERVICDASAFNLCFASR